MEPGGSGRVSARRWLRALPSLAVMGLVVAACAPDVQVDSTSVATDTAGIWVSGVGETSLPPDYAEVQISVAAIRPTVRSAVADSAVDMAAVLEAIEAEGIASDDIETRRYSVGTYFEFRDRIQVRLGYLAANSVRVTIRDLDLTGNVIDGAAEAGGDEVKIDRMTFGVDEPEAAATEARQEAWDDALAKAGELAELSGQDLGEAAEINEGVERTFTSPLPVTNGGSTTTPVEPGQVEVVVTLDVRFEAN